MTELVKVGSEGKYTIGLDDEDRTNYIKAMNTERDTYNQIEYARESGREEGREEGRAEGHKVGKEEGLKEGQYKIAMNLIRLGASCEIITQATGLSAEDVSRLKERTNSIRRDDATATSVTH